MRYGTILADPPWNQGTSGKWRKPEHSGHYRGNAGLRIPYPVMPLDEILSLPVARLADEACHLWLWTTNQHLESGFQVMRAWGFKYLAPITWVKPSGIGNYFVHRTQTLLFGYRKKCLFPLARFKPTVLVAGCPPKHSRKPLEAYDLIESVSPGPRLEMFARGRRLGWEAWGNEVESTVDIATA